MASSMNDVDRLLIVGAGGHANVVADSAVLSLTTTISFIGERPENIYQIPDSTVYSPQMPLSSFVGQYDAAICAIGNNTIRLRCHLELMELGFNVPAIVHPTAAISSHAVIGAGAMVMANSVVGIGADVGAAVIVNNGSIVEHDNKIGDGAHISPGATLGGCVVVGERSWIGVGATVRNSQTVGADSTVGAGAVVVRDVPSNETWAGVPARRLYPA